MKSSIWETYGRSWELANRGHCPSESWTLCVSTLEWRRWPVRYSISNVQSFTQSLELIYLERNLFHFPVQELQQLFEKLDVDRDGKVGFHEFLNGLFQHGAITPTPSHPAPTPRPKLHLTAVDDRSLHSPTCIGSTGIFSSLEGDTSGWVYHMMSCVGGGWGTHLWSDLYGKLPWSSRIIISASGENIFNICLNFLVYS